MAWGAWARKPAGAAATAAIGLDLNASRARAVGGPLSGAAPRAIPLDDDRSDLPLTIHLESRSPTVGEAGYELVRSLPHAVCSDFLAEIGRPRIWSTPRGRIDAVAAVGLVAAHLQRLVPAGHALFLVVPPYLTDRQQAHITDAFARSRLAVSGVAAAPIALAATCEAQYGTALVLDADEHALTWSVLATEGANARLLAHQAVPAAGVRAWFDRLIDAVSDRCVRLCRRDPRDTASAEQSLFEQLDAALSAPYPSDSITLNIRTLQWFQELTLSRDELASFAQPLSRMAIEAMRQAVEEAHTAVPVMARPELLWITADAARLPGLAAAATQHVPESTNVQTLPPDALATAGYVLGGHVLRGDCVGGVVGPMAPRLASRSPGLGTRSDIARGRSHRI